MLAQSDTVRSTRPKSESNRPAVLVDRGFVAEAPNRMWVADISYPGTFVGKVNVAF